MTSTRPNRLLALALIGLAGTLAAFAAGPGGASAAAFDEGVVTVDGYGWSVNSKPVDVQLNDIANAADGQTTYTVLDILKKANESTGEFSWQTAPGIQITLPGSAVEVKCTGDQVRAQSSQCPVFHSTADATSMTTKSGKTVKYQNANPVLYVSQPPDMTVKLSPAARQIKSGDSVTFTAKVSGARGKQTFDWSFGDGKTTRTGTGTVQHVFKGSDKTFNVVVEVSSTGNSRNAEAASVITIGKVKKTKKKQKKEQEAGGPPDQSGTYDPGYVPGYDPGDGSGTGTGAGSPSGTSDPGGHRKQKKRQKPTQPVDDGLETVSGELIDPGSTATVTPPSDDSGTSGEQAAPADDEKSGGGISKGAMTALGIGALLGLGGLAEAGAFAGFGRFRLRP